MNKTTNKAIDIIKIYANKAELSIILTDIKNGCVIAAVNRIWSISEISYKNCVLLIIQLAKEELNIIIKEKL